MRRNFTGTPKYFVDINMVIYYFRLQNVCLPMTLCYSLIFETEYLRMRHTYFVPSENYAKHIDICNLEYSCVFTETINVNRSSMHKKKTLKAFEESIT